MCLVPRQRRIGSVLQEQLHERRISIGPSEQVFRNRHRISVNIFRIRVLDQKRLPMKTTASPWHWQRHEGV